MNYLQRAFPFALLALAPTLLLPVFAQTQDGFQPQTGEIEVSGTISRMLPKHTGFVLAVTTLTRPDGTVTRLDPPRPKTVLAWAAPAYFKPGDTVTATGKDLGPGKNLPARSYKSPRLSTAGSDGRTVPVRTVAADTPSAPNLPAPWKDADIGKVGVPGAASFAGKTFTVTASGDDIFGQADAFHFVYRPLHGDGQIIARVVSYERKDTWTKVGVMVRETTDPGSKFVDILVTPDKGAESQWRASTNGDTQTTDQVPSPTPFWVKLVRAGDTLTSYVSPDGQTWQQRGQATVSMTPDALIGLCVTSHKNDTTTEAKIDSVTVGK